MSSRFGGISHGLLESFATSFRRESFSPRGFLRGEKVAKPDEGAYTQVVAIDRHAQMAYARERPLIRLSVCNLEHR